MLLIAFKSLAVSTRKEGIYRAIFKRPDISHLTVDIVGNHLKSTEQESLPHHIKIGTEGIENPHTSLLRESLEFRIIFSLGQRVVHGFNKTVCCQKI